VVMLGMVVALGGHHGLSLNGGTALGEPLR